MHIAVIQTAFLGDLFLSIPLLKNLKTYYPTAKLSLVCRKGIGRPLQTAGIVDEILEIEKGSSQSYRSIVDHFRGQRVDMLFCPHKSFRSAMLAQKIKVDSFKVSFSRWWNFFVFDKRIPYPSHLPDALRQLSLLALVNKDFRVLFEMATRQNRFDNPNEVGQTVDFRSLELPEWSRMHLQKFVHEGHREKTVVLAPGSVWNTKKWTEDGFTQVASDFLKKGFNVILMGSQAEHSLCESIRQKVPQAINLSGQTSLEESLKILGKSQLLVANDSGAMHLASAVATPTVSIFGPTTLTIGYRPWNQNAIVVQKKLDCRPCGKHGHNKCPIGTHECMKGIEASQVIEQSQKLISEN